MRARIVTAMLIAGCGVLGFLVFRERIAHPPPEETSVSPAPSAEILAAEWSAFQGGGELTGETVALPVSPMRLRWEAKVGECGESSPVIAGGAVYVADGEGGLYALRIDGGKALWRREFADGFDATPLVVPSPASPDAVAGRVFIGDSAGAFRALATGSGNELWRFETGDQIVSSANAFEGAVLFGSYDHNLYCLDRATGTELWRFETDAQVHTTPAVAGGIVFCGGCDGVLRAVDARTGEETWKAEVGSAIASAPTCFGSARAGRVFVATLEGAVICFSMADGTRLWRREFEGESFYGSPALSDGRLVIPGRGDGVWCLDAGSGRTLWTFRSRRGFDSSPAVAGGGVYLTGKDGKLHVLDVKTGKEVWSFSAGSEIRSSPAVGAGVLVFCDARGTVYCLAP